MLFPVGSAQVAEENLPVRGATNRDKTDIIIIGNHISCGDRHIKWCLYPSALEESQTVVVTVAYMCGPRPFPSRRGGTLILP